MDAAATLSKLSPAVTVEPVDEVSASPETATLGCGSKSARSASSKIDWKTPGSENSGVDIAVTIAVTEHSSASQSETHAPFHSLFPSMQAVHSLAPDPEQVSHEPWHTTSHRCPGFAPVAICHHHLSIALRHNLSNVSNLNRRQRHPHNVGCTAAQAGAGSGDCSVLAPATL